MNNLFLYYANLVDYLRILLLIASLLQYKSGSYVHFLVLYCISQALDAVDGYLARKFNQTSDLGLVLDQLIDRIASFALSLIAAYKNPHECLLILTCLSLDIFGHWALQLANALINDGTHKRKYRGMLGIYYSSKSIMVALIVSTEVFLMSLCCSPSIPTSSSIYYITNFAKWISLPGYLLRSVS